MQTLSDNSTIQIREFGSGDALSPAPVYAQLHPERPLSPHQIKQHFQQILESNGRIWTITQTKEPAGYGAIYPVPGLPTLVEIEGGITPAKQRQGWATHLLQHIITTLKIGTIQQLSYSVSNLDTPAAHFLQHHHFFIEHEELHLELADLQTCHFPLPTSYLQLADHDTAVSTFPTLYDHSFAHTRWHQPYSPDEMAATLSPTDDLFFCLHNSNPIGFAWVRYPNRVTAEIEPIGIVQAWQGKGYGRSLLNAVLHKLQQQNIQHVRLGVWADNQLARHLYHQFGFTHQSTTTYLAYNL